MERYGIGQPVRRKEDLRLLTGRGRFTDDLNLEGQVHAYILRSPYAHARINAIDTTKARAAPGVVAVFTGADIESDSLGTIPCQVDIPQKNGEPMFRPPRHVLAVDRVRFVGDPVAMVVAGSHNEARDAAELIEVDYEELPAVVNPARAVEPDAPRLWPECHGNVCTDWENQESAAVDEIFAGADRIVAVDLVNNRVIPNPMEPRCALAGYDAETDCSILYAPTQGAHRIHRPLTQSIFKIAPEKLRVISYDTGGGFGSRSKVYPELILVIWASRRLARPVKWQGDRSETFVSETHGRDNLTHAELALDGNGKAVALRVATIANMGAYLSDIGPRVPTLAGGRVTGTVYAIPAIHVSVRCVFTNTAPTDAYRGAGRPEVVYVMERLMDMAAAEIGIDRAEIRRRNFIPTSALPYTNTMNLVIDSGDFAGTLEKALARSDWNGFEQRRADAAARGKRRGIGIGYYLEAAGGQPSEQAQVRFAPDGSVVVVVGTYSHGQGHETAFSQIVVERLGVPFDGITFVQGDTALVPFGHGTAGSRSSQMGGVAIARACDKIVEKGKLIAAHLLQADGADVGFETGVFRASRGAVTIAEVAKAALDPDKLPDGLDPGFDATYHYDRGTGTFNFPNGCHVCEVEIDPETGVVEVVRFTAVDDCGTVINPMIVHGQAHGGIAQGIGQALYEHTVYDDESGQLVSGSYLDYVLPRADNLPSIDVSFNEVPSPTNDLGVKGAGESGACGAPAAVVNAVVDALKDLGVRHVDMPLTPEQVWRVIRDAEASGAVARHGR
ncbi:MAG: xanthine dehydrogenase family protein molybdopterin-binding subunit [Alphaproteobacteria bacterium]